jgi:hypothetical protein
MISVELGTILATWKNFVDIGDNGAHHSPLFYLLLYSA